MSEWLDVIPWILGATAVTLGFLIFPGPTETPIPIEAPVRGADVIDLAEFRQRRQQAQGTGGR